MRWVGVFLSPKGRVGRKDFWLAQLVLAGLAAILLRLGPAGPVLAVLLAISQVCLFSKRLHDLGESGWFSAVPCALAAAAMLAFRLTAEQSGVPAVVTIGGVLTSAACAIIGLVFFVRIGIARPEPDASAGAALGPEAEPGEEPRRAA